MACNAKPDWDYYLDQPTAKTLAERASSGAPMAGNYKAATGHMQEGPYFTDEAWAEKLQNLPIGSTYRVKPPGQQAAKIDWEKLAQSYAAALAEANSRIRELEAQVTKLTPLEPEPEPSAGDVLAKVLGHDNWPGVYGR